MAATCPLTARLVKGAVLGGSLGALGAWAAFNWSTSGGEGDGGDEADPLRSRAIALLQAYPNVASDSNLYVALQEPVPVFLQVDADMVRLLLESLDLLVGTVVSVNHGSTRPGDVAKAIRARREANNRLHALVRKSRQTKPLLASELEEDLQTIKKCVDGHVHNCMHQSNLNIMENVA
jgi:hypothetical protein